MSLNLIVLVAAVLGLIVLAIFLVTEFIPRQRSKKRHKQHLDQLFQFDHLRDDSGPPTGKRD